MARSPVKSVFPKHISYVKIVVAFIVGLVVCARFGAGEAAASPVMFEDNPVRPHNSAKLFATAGVVVAYKPYATSDMLSPRITIYDEIERKERTVSLSYKTTIDGRMLRCNDFAHLDDTSDATLPILPALNLARENNLCLKLPPSVTLGKTRVVVLYWKYDNATTQGRGLSAWMGTLDQNAKSDAIWILPSQPP